MTKNLKCGGAEDEFVTREGATTILHLLKNTIQKLKELPKHQTNVRVVRILSRHTVNKFPVLWAFNTNVVNEAEYIMGDLRLQDEGDIIMEDGHQVSPSYR